MQTSFASLIITPHPKQSRVRIRLSPLTASFGAFFNHQAKEINAYAFQAILSRQHTPSRMAIQLP